jgi:hypothetical protein
MHKRAKPDVRWLLDRPHTRTMTTEKIVVSRHRNALWIDNQSDAQEGT